MPSCGVPLVRRQLRHSALPARFPPFLRADTRIGGAFGFQARRPSAVRRNALTDAGRMIIREPTITEDESATIRKKH